MAWDGVHRPLHDLVRSCGVRRMCAARSCAGAPAAHAKHAQVLAGAEAHLWLGPLPVIYCSCIRGEARAVATATCRALSTPQPPASRLAHCLFSYQMYTQLGHLDPQLHDLQGHTYIACLYGRLKSQLIHKHTYRRNNESQGSHKACADQVNIQG